MCVFKWSEIWTYIFYWISEKVLHLLAFKITIISVVKSINHVQNVCACVRACACVCEDIFSVLIIQNAYKSYRVSFLGESRNVSSKG